MSINSQVVAVDPSHPQAKSLLNNLGGLNLNKVMERRKEPLLVPYYKLMTLEQLEEVNYVPWTSRLVVSEFVLLSQQKWLVLLPHLY